jgi:hypothetical protein
MGVDLKKNTTGSDSVKKPRRVEDFVKIDSTSSAPTQVQ